jgi:hypothetical protein
MKKVIFTICLLLLVKLLIAQDIIVKKDGTRIKSKILNVTISGISYKNFFDLEGPTYTLRSREISRYTYENESDSKDSRPTDDNNGINTEEKKSSQTNNNSSEDKSLLQDVVYLKNGSIIKGVISEQIPNVSLKIETSDGSIFVYKSEEIEKIAKVEAPLVNNEAVQTTRKIPDVDVKEYGSHFSMGIAIGGGGIIGIPIRVFLHQNIPFEIAVHLRPILFAKATTNNNGTNSLSSIEIYPNLLITGEFDFFFGRKYVPYKRISLSGIFIKGGYSTGTRFDGILGAIGWQYERFKLNQKNNSFSFGLGIGVEQLTDKTAKQSDKGGWYGQMETPQEVYIKPMLYWKIAWNLFVRTKKQV